MRQFQVSKGVVTLLAWKVNQSKRDVLLYISHCIYCALMSNFITGL